RLQPVSAADPVAAYRTAHASARDARLGDVPGVFARKSRRGFRAVARSAYNGDQLLSRSRGFQRAANPDRPAVVPGQGPGGSDPGMVGGMRNRRGSVIDRDVAGTTCRPYSRASKDPDFRFGH